MPRATKDPSRRNIHLDVPQEFHREIKLMCAYRDVSIQAYAMDAIKIKLEVDNKAISQEKASTKSTAPAKAPKEKK